MVTYPMERPLQRSLFAVTVAFSALAVLSVVLRIVGRVKLGRWLDGSDYVMIVSALAMLTLATAISNALFHAGLGFHEEEIINRFGVATGELDFYKHLLVARIATTVSLALSKISILLLCSRVFTSKTFHLISNLTMGLISVWCVGSIVVALKICTPLEFVWNKSLENGKCGPENTVYSVLAVINIIADMIVLVLPMPYIYRLQLATYKKVTLLFTFGVGFIVCIVSIVKTAILPTVDMNDVSWSIQYALILAMLESSLAIIVACIPVLRPLFKKSLAARHANTHAHNSRYYSTMPPATSGGGGSVGLKGFSELRNLINGQHSGDTDEEPLPMRPEKTYYNRIEAGGRPSTEARMRGHDVEMGGMGGITVKTEFTASIEVVEVLNKTTRNSVRKSQRGSIQH